MIELITGLPGNGKTVYAVKYVKEWAEKDKRPVFYAGIEIVDKEALPWTEIDPQKWYEAPPGAIVLIDECQTVFRPRMMGKEPPLYVSKLETHRHQGVDIVLITQHPMLVDTAIRRLTGLHKHCIRKWGTESSTIHEWPSVRDNCDKNGARKDSEKHAWTFDKKIYPLYKSAEIHTVKRRIPMRVWLLLLCPFFILLCIWGVWKLMFSDAADKLLNKDKAVQTEQSSTSAFSSGLFQPQKKEREKWEDPIADAQRFTFEATPRVSGLPHTAPKYDEVTQPTTAPMPSCVASKSVCKCYSQQATIMDVPNDLCRQIVDKGYFVDFEVDRDRQQAKQEQNRLVAALNQQEQEHRESRSSPDSEKLATGFGVNGSRRDVLRQPGI